MRELRRRNREYSATAGLGFDDADLERRLVWIWTSPRSGSTWLLRLLCHPLKLDNGPGEPGASLGWRPSPGWSGPLDAFPVDSTFLGNHLAPVTGEVPYDESSQPISFRSYPGMAAKPSYFFSSAYEDAWRPEIRRLALVRFQRFLERAGELFELSDPLLLVKEVGGTHASELVMSLFPDSRLIFLVRDGRDVVDSQLHASGPGGWLPLTEDLESPGARLEFVRRRCRAWLGDVATIERALEAHPPALGRVVRYEDLLADTAGTLGPLIEWMGLRRSPRWLERAVEANSFDRIPQERRGPGKFFRAATPGHWRSSLRPQEQRVARELLAPKLAELGYQP